MMLAVTGTAMDATAYSTETARTGAAAVATLVATNVGVVIGEVALASAAAVMAQLVSAQGHTN